MKKWVGGKMDKIWGNPQKNKAGYRKRISTTDLEAARKVRGTDDQNPVTNTVEYLYLHTKGAAPVNDTEKSKFPNSTRFSVRPIFVALELTFFRLFLTSSQ